MTQIEEDVCRVVASGSKTVSAIVSKTTRFGHTEDDVKKALRSLVRREILNFDRRMNVANA